MREPIDSRQLQIFFTLARTGNLGDAARELGITNSAISHSIHVLEESLGTKLFYRPGKTLILSEQGHYLAKEALSILTHMYNIRSVLAGPILDDHTTLRVAVGFNFMSRPLPDVMREWQQCFPKATLAAQAAERDACLNLLKNDSVDGAVLVDPPEDMALDRVPLFEDALRVLVSTENALGRAETVTIKSLHQKVLFVSRMQSHTTQRILSEIRRRGFSLRDCIEVGSGPAIMEMIKAGNGFALLPEWTFSQDIDESSLVWRTIEDAEFTRKWAYVRKTSTPPSFMSRTFLRLCQRICEELAATPRLA
ncbi:MAG TPA: LysR family transcriptional regulator [Opitutaceae bacterium]